MTSGGERSPYGLLQGACVDERVRLRKRVVFVRLPGGDDLARMIRRATNEAYPACTEELARYLAHGVENVSRIRRSGHQGSDSTKSSLLVADAVEVVESVHVRDRGSHKFGESKESILCVIGESFWPERIGHENAPSGAIDQDRCANARLKSHLERDL